MIAIVDCGIGNLHSVEAGLHRAGAKAQLVTTAAEIDAADQIIFPGDGHFASCISALDARGLRAALLQAAKEKPFLGICIGMQMLYEGSEEAPDTPGLGILPGYIRRLPTAAGKIPHMGWNTVRHTRSHFLFNNVADNTRFYFVHSYYVVPDAHTIGITEYGVAAAAVTAYDNVVATQFHPEKSGKQGAQLLRNFIA